MPEAEWIVVHSREQEGVVMQFVVPIDLYQMVRDGQMAAATAGATVLMTRSEAAHQTPSTEPAAQKATTSRMLDVRDHSMQQSGASQSRVK
jgi:hypothetical protein